MTDYIKREDAIKVFRDYLKTLKERTGYSTIPTEDAIDILADIPSADVVERRHIGKETIEVGDGFCPNCGADMRGSDNE